MNITFSLTSSYEREFTSSNLNSDIVIEQISVCTGSDVVGSCILLDTINNMQQQTQSHLVVINDIYQSDYVNIVVPKTSKWRFYLTDKEGHSIHVKTPVIVNLWYLRED